MTALPEHQSTSSPATGGPDGDDTDWAESSVFGGTRGMPWWGAVVLATLLTALGTLLDVLIWNRPGILFTACYVVGCLLAVALVRRRSLFGPMVQPPLVLAIIMPIIVLTVGSGIARDAGTTELVLAVASPLIKGFPAMAMTTGVVLGVGLLRMFVLESGKPAGRAGRGSKGNSEATAKKAARSSADRSSREQSAGGRGKQAADEGAKRPSEAAGKQRSQGKGRGSRTPAAGSEAEQRAAGRPQRRGDTGGSAAEGRSKPSGAGKQRPRPGVGAGGTSDNRKARPHGQERGEQSAGGRTPGEQNGRPRGRSRGEQPPNGGQARGNQPPGRARGSEARPERGDRSTPPERSSGPRSAPPGRAKPPERSSGGEQPPRRPRRPRREGE
ncbi:DUF6542 domain-containing protein [Haloactinomyces albus]|uniref:DUF6542 domain-containing protein n=1 Tax=Haloactinomyces albus TaxID=1352928 RepID=A0AAE3ZF62_9ACTN|nr:DUF6542 domain-containing protein [Haloactinomyces albus]MDR7302746.1 hypothetical protein [Haloactinomyces albus]